MAGSPYLRGRRARRMARCVDADKASAMFLAFIRNTRSPRVLSGGEGEVMAVATRTVKKVDVDIGRILFGVRLGLLGALVGVAVAGVIAAAVGGGQRDLYDLYGAGAGAFTMLVIKFFHLI